MFIRFPVVKLSKHITIWFSEINFSQRLLPRKPAPPVTSEMRLLVGNIVL